MEIQYTLQDISFKWSLSKAEKNQVKHSVSFHTACEVFFDPFIMYFDEEKVGDEIREKVIGMSEDWRILLIVFVIREDKIRLISARKATNFERAQYEYR